MTRDRATPFWPLAKPAYPEGWGWDEGQETDREPYCLAPTQECLCEISPKRGAVRFLSLSVSSRERHGPLFMIRPLFGPYQCPKGGQSMSRRQNPGRSPHLLLLLGLSFLWRVALLYDSAPSDTRELSRHTALLVPWNNQGALPPLVAGVLWGYVSLQGHNTSPEHLTLESPLLCS